MKTEKSLKSRALDYLARRDYSRWELKRKLAPYAEDEDELDALLDELAEKHWQSDERFVENFVHSKSQKHGSLRLKQALKMKGVDEQTIASFLPDKKTELATAQAVWQKKFGRRAQTPQEKQKQIRFLLYRGFQMDVVMKVLKMDWDNY